MFWFAAIAILAGAGLLLAWPLLARGSSWRATGLAIVLLLPLGGTLLYRDVGTPAAMNPAVRDMDATDFDTLADELKARLSERPEDLEGWLLLGRSLKSLQRFDEALEALETAQRIAPENPLVKVELAEAMLFASGDPRVNEDTRALLVSAVEAEPDLQKGLWLLGLDAAQRGEDLQAIDYWERLLRQVEPGTPVAESVREQIDGARSRLGQAPGAPSDLNDLNDGGDPGEQDGDGAWPGVSVRIDLAPPAAEALPNPLPETAVLFVIIRPTGMDQGPPLGVARIDQPGFPLEITVDDRHAMLPGRLLSAQPALRLQARLSLGGQPTAQTGDWQSAFVEIAPEDSAEVALSLSSAVD